MVKSSQTGKGPVSSGYLKMFCQVFSYGVEVFAVLEAEGVLKVLLAVEGGRGFLVVHWWGDGIGMRKILFIIKFLMCKSEGSNCVIVTKKQKTKNIK